ncbi:hypothetical protein [Cupriavidus nantongensis]|uniref:Uncharacterized protein n=1 Tax=Cupriavidus nantongensis TaxID=1796606 RepID=A0A142JHS2_9BURK|nr:hypothetical protein [Cupriavidus nantongensis]AMR77634.1 hypothetical protein A2G96_07740 [Cupriavidus nantongensis]
MEEITKAMPIEMVGHVGKCQSHPGGYEHAAKVGYSKPSASQIAAYAMRALEAARAKDLEAHEKNLAALAHNQALRERVIALMKAAGIPDTWSERDHASRARYPKSRTVSAGYLGDLAKHVVVSDGFASATSTYESLKKRYEEYAATAAQEAKRAEQLREAEAERQKEERRKNIALASIILRYGLDQDSDWPDVLEALCAKHQRLDLAVAMQQTRGDWSEGPYRVRNALDRFQIETTEDKDIANDILACLEDFCDGRVFRDTTWSYDRLFASVEDQQLAADVQQAAINVRD